MTEIGFEKDVREYRIISKETKKTKVIALTAFIFIFILGFISYIIDSNRNQINTTKKSTKISKNIVQKINSQSMRDNDSNVNGQERIKKIEKIFSFFNIFIILLLIAILAVKKTAYYSSKFIKENDSLEQVLIQWRKIDISLICIAQVIPILGIIITIIGIEFRRTTHFFIAAILLIFMLMPMSIKIRSRLNILKKYFTNIL